MRNSIMVFIFSILLLINLGCAHCPSVDPQYKIIMELDNYMIPLAKAVDVIADKVPTDAIDGAIFSAAVQSSGNPGLTKPFEEYLLKARVEDGVGIILLCYKDGNDALIEDATCTARPDMHRPTGSPCDYMLDVKRVCSLR